MTYKVNSHWNKENELKCLVIFKKLESQNFLRGKQAEYCRDVAKNTKLDAGNISAKVCNFKSIAGVNSKSNASKNTISIYKEYGHLSINEIEKLFKNV